jgi:hypothetical protein
MSSRYWAERASTSTWCSCLGFLYHTYRHTELFYRLHQLAPQHLILDTVILPGKRPILRVIPEQDSADIRAAAPDAFSMDRVLVTRPTMAAVTMLLSAYRFEVESRYDWKAWFAGRPSEPGLKDYEEGKRVSLRCRHGEAAITDGSELVAPVPSARVTGYPPRRRTWPPSQLRRTSIKR